MVAGPEICRLVTEYEDVHDSKKNMSTTHHEQTPSVQKAFLLDVKNVVDEFTEKGNPFEETGKYLYSLDTNVIVSPVMHFMTLSKNNVTWLKASSKESASRSKVANKALKGKSTLFLQMYLGCQSRGGDVDTFFQHENHAWPHPYQKQMNSVVGPNQICFPVWNNCLKGPKTPQRLV